jgi:hypothetical protein
MQLHCPPVCARFLLGGTCDKETVLIIIGDKNPDFRLTDYAV